MCLQQAAIIYTLSRTIECNRTYVRVDMPKTAITETSSPTQCCLSTSCGYSGKRLTIESEVAKEGSQEVHDIHDSNGDVGDTLHLLFGWATRTQKHNERGSIPSHLKTQAFVFWSLFSTHSLTDKEAPGNSYRSLGKRTKI